MWPQQRVGEKQGDPAQLAGRATYWAWRSTALAGRGWCAGGPSGQPGGVEVLGVVLALTGAATLVASRRRWRAISEAIAAGRPVPSTRLPLLVSSVVIMTSLALVA